MQLLRRHFASRRLARTYRSTRGAPKVIYALTPPARLKNIGDQAQAVAIHRWIARHFPNHAVVEADKDDCIHAVEGLKTVVEPGDWILLHSGGNLGDRGKWSEKARRTIIQSFPDNRIVSLPQTIFFSDTEDGRAERAKTERIYGAHPDLTVIGRDPESGQLARELFPRAKTFCVPDFVLSLPPRPGKAVNVQKPKVLLCLRRDSESVLDQEKREALAQAIGYETRMYDTTIFEEIPKERRESVLDETLGMFAEQDLVVTDRFHGLIFALLTRRPTVVLRTVDHKLTSAFHWFEGVKFIQFAENLGEVPQVLERVKQVEDFSVPDFNALYFDRILSQVEEGPRP